MKVVEDERHTADRVLPRDRHARGTRQKVNCARLGRGDEEVRGSIAHRGAVRPGRAEILARDLPPAGRTLALAAPAGAKEHEFTAITRGNGYAFARGDLFRSLEVGSEVG